jgi:hypothetical protein
MVPDQLNLLCVDQANQIPILHPKEVIDAQGLFYLYCGYMFVHEEEVGVFRQIEAGICEV